MRTITIKGEGRINRKPDQVILSINVETSSENYDAIIIAINEKVETLSRALERNNIARDLLKTSNFLIDTEYENVQQTNGTYKRIFKGYKAREYLTLKLPFDNLKISLAFKAITDSKIKPEVSISFGIDATKGITDELLKLVSEDAHRQASILAKANGLKVGQLLNIYHQANEPETRLTHSLMTLRRTDAVIDFNPEDIFLADSATFVYELLD